MAIGEEMQVALPGGGRQEAKQVQSVVLELARRYGDTWKVKTKSTRSDEGVVVYIRKAAKASPFLLPHRAVLYTQVPERVCKPRKGRLKPRQPETTSSGGSRAFGRVCESFLASEREAWQATDAQIVGALKAHRFREAALPTALFGPRSCWQAWIAVWMRTLVDLVRPAQAKENA